jgi:hypothetical protein
MGMLETSVEEMERQDVENRNAIAVSGRGVGANVRDDAVRLRQIREVAAT